jgi:hypothetical protein
MSASNEQFDMVGQSNAHPNPMFNFLTGFVPRKLKDMYRWTEYIYYNSPHIFIALQKLADYVITDITFKTESESLRKKYEDIILKKLRGKVVLKGASKNRALYGNGFYSMYFPFKRIVPCNSCGMMWDIRRIGDYDFDFKKRTFKYDCRSCGSKSATHLDDVRDVKVYDPKRMNIISWDPKHIDVEHNPITGHTDYYYDLPSELRQAIKDGDRHMIDGTPKAFIDAADHDQVFHFAEGKLFHLKGDVPAGLDGALGYPSIISVMKQFYFVEVMRRSNEAIALDHLTPFRVLHPAATSASNDPVKTMAFAQWIDETKKNIKQWRKDPLHIMFAPVALGVTQMGGQGRTLLTLGEVQEAENNIIAGLGVPREFLYGGLSFTGSSVTLRMLENQLLSHSADLGELLQWLCDGVADYQGWEKVEANITNFRFIDDTQQKALLMQADAQYGILSRRKVAETLDVDFDDEQDAMEQEQLDSTRRQAELDRKLTELQSTLAEKAQAEAAGTTGLEYDQQAIIAEADAMAMELGGAEEGQRRSFLAQLQAEDAVMYAVVIQRLEQHDLDRTNEAKAMVG